MKERRTFLLLLLIVITFIGCPVVDTSLHVTYQGNQNTGGSAPTDAISYNQGNEVTILGNSGSLVKSEYTFDGWNTKADGTGTSYEEGETFTIGSQSVTLYAEWTPLPSIKAVAAGSGFSYILKNDGTLWVTGINGAGQLGDGTNTNRSSAYQIMDGVKAISASRYQHAMILDEDGNLYGVGDNSAGQLGLPDSINYINTPELIKTGIASVSCGYYYTMAIDTDGNLLATGSNGISGVLGNDSEENSFGFIQIDTDVLTVSAGNRHTLYVNTDGNLYAMGDSNNGKLGRPYSSSNTYDRSPVLVSGISDVRAVSAGENHSLVITNSNELWSFGWQNDGQLLDSIDNESGSVSTPTKVLDNIKFADAGSNKSMVITTSDELYVVGYNTAGLLGDGTATYRQTYASPEKVRTGVYTCSMGVDHSLIIDNDSTVYGAGYNSTGQLGQGTTDYNNHYAFLEIPLITSP